MNSCHPICLPRSESEIAVKEQSTAAEPHSILRPTLISASLPTKPVTDRDLIEATLSTLLKVPRYS